MSALPTALVFPQAVTNRTRVRDFERAHIPLADDDGRVADLHSLRHTYGTELARSGVPPQDLQKLMRHAKIEQTLDY